MLLAAYIYAKHLDRSHLVPKSERLQLVDLPLGKSSARFFYRCLPDPARRHYVNVQDNDRATTHLMGTTIGGYIDEMRTRLRAGANLEICHPVKGTALIIACAQGQLPSIKFLVRQGAKLECTANDLAITALEAAMGNHEVTRWFLVDRFTDQYKLTDTPFNSDKHVGTRHWSGVRQVQISLKGKYKRPMETSLMEHARELRRITRDNWRFLVPLSWDTIAHLTPLPEELSSKRG